VPDDDQPDPFAGIPFLGEAMRALGGSGPLNWDLARQFAAMAAVGDVPDPQPDPAVRYELNDLARVARMRLAARGIGSESDTTEFLAVSRAEWARRTLADWQPLFANLAAALDASGGDDASADGGDPFAAMLSRLTAMVAPAMLGMAVGSMVGTMARGALGQYDVLLPRPAPAGTAREILVVPGNVDGFATDWSLSVAEVRMWVLIHELTAHAALAGSGAGAALGALVTRHVTAFRPDASGLSDRFGGIDLTDNDAMAEAAKLLSDPTVLLGAVRSREQEEMAPLLESHVAALAAWIDDTVDAIAAELLGQVGTLAEAVRRRRRETAAESVFFRTLFGLDVSRERADAGRSFVVGVRERAGNRADDVLANLVSRIDGLPTPNELVAPGLWMARLNLD
jgi:putative hydrolase